MDELNDIELVEQVQAGNSQGAAVLYQRYRQSIFRYVVARVSDAQLAQDLTGEIFLRMVSNLPTYRITGAPFTAWLFRIAHNYTITYSRQEQGRQSLAGAQLPLRHRRDDNPAVLVERRLELESLISELDRIDENQREVLILRFLVGLSLKEVALILDKTVGAVKTLQHRGVLALRVTLQE